MSTSAPGAGPPEQQQPPPPPGPPPPTSSASSAARDNQPAVPAAAPPHAPPGQNGHATGARQLVVELNEARLAAAKALLAAEYGDQEIVVEFTKARALGLMVEDKDDLTQVVELQNDSKGRWVSGEGGSGCTGGRR